MHSIVKSWKKIFIILAAVILCSGCKNAFLPPMSYNPWEVIQLPTEVTLFDIGFTDDSDHGWIVGGDTTLLETTDGGKTWEPKTIDLEEKVRLTSVSFNGNEGWIVGQPSLLLHTDDGGESWSTIPLSSKLPGAPNTIIALGPNSAEMTTDVGAIYRTKDGGQNWRAQVEDAVGVVRNISRSSDGKYIAVSAKGNFYSTWEPGQTSWTPHNRQNSRRLENMGFGDDGRLWLLARGGQLRFSDPENLEEWGEAINPEYATSWGLLDLAYRTPDEIWISGGSGNLLRSTDGGQTWEKDLDVENVPENFYNIVFINSETGFILGQRGTMLKYNSSAVSEAA
ncbi:MAG: photosynthesis system II assembly factor Ycf48 [Okeania sp. SIO2F4]|uniref:photosynthesis system II assembly factor Ycf48 n=1 Tax=Okeania sp. SIO2F4 TaxID=2607790 RepID=UPI00142CD1AA|nr:photosynthesis system II assembly factor Ycf48 [Okeania sp. SIO2F4]NES05659.1 photosynthesis system II assembly factor Ycf48 [Okeania sp. SIO2F4]